MEGRKFKAEWRSWTGFSKRSTDVECERCGCGCVYGALRIERASLNVAPNLEYSWDPLAQPPRIRTNVSGLILEILRRSDPRADGSGGEKKTKRKNPTSPLWITVMPRHRPEVLIFASRYLRIRVLRDQRTKIACWHSDDILIRRNIDRFQAVVFLASCLKTRTFNSSTN